MRLLLLFNTEVEARQTLTHFKFTLQDEERQYYTCSYAELELSLVIYGIGLACACTFPINFGKYDFIWICGVSGFLGEGLHAESGQWVSAQEISFLPPPYSNYYAKQFHEKHYSNLTILHPPCSDQFQIYPAFTSPWTIHYDPNIIKHFPSPCIIDMEAYFIVLRAKEYGKTVSLMKIISDRIDCPSDSSQILTRLQKLSYNLADQIQTCIHAMKNL